MPGAAAGPAASGEGLLAGRTAVVYGGGGSIGAAVGLEFARQGARVFLAGRTEGPLEEAAAAITAAGGRAEATVLDALDEQAVEDHLARVVAETGRVDVSFNLTTRGDVQGVPLLAMTPDDLLRAVDHGLRSNFLTARAAARRMSEQGSGVILHLNSGSAQGAMPGMGSTGPADAAVETFMRYLAAETGAAGVRVCGMWTAGVAETLTKEKLATVAGAAAPDPEAVLAGIASMSAMHRTPRLADVTGTAVFLASDLASGLTGTVVNVTAGLVLR
ncbi:SDR family oxidoreductase [Streptomyces sp. PLK6-54]|uniref:SDR family oxidoreductase n=2 Tax=Actinacidiphila acidipaludis TaxID=2873382 RepID=A0ABS7QHI6_9ACTN|nr:SDR family oxidoreductase [Streptomyces acidipaludis]